MPTEGRPPHWSQILTYFLVVAPTCGSAYLVLTGNTSPLRFGIYSFAIASAASLLVRLLYANRIRAAEAAVSEERREAVVFVSQPLSSRDQLLRARFWVAPGWAVCWLAKAAVSVSTRGSRDATVVYGEDVLTVSLFSSRGPILLALASTGTPVALFPVERRAGECFPASRSRITALTHELRRELVG